MRIKLGAPLSLKDITRAVNGIRQSNVNPKIEYISTDTRELEKGDLFIPIKGVKFDGEDFVDEAIKKGAFTLSLNNKNTDIRVTKSDRPLLDLAAYYNNFLPYILYRIGITGSVGKTTTKEFLKVILSEGYKVHANSGNLNNEIGLPLSVLSAPLDTEILIMEMGMNHLGEISRLSKCLCPDLGIITNIGSSHIGNLGSKENIARAKLEILDGMKGGGLYVLEEEKLLKNAENRVSLSLKNPSASFYLERILGGVAIYKNKEKLLEAGFAFSEDHHLECLLFATALALDTGLPPRLVSQGISKISTDNIRQTAICTTKYLIIDDSYNASLESIMASINGLKISHPDKRKSLVLGDVLELGEFSQEYHYKIGKAIPPDLFSDIFLFGSNAEYTALGAIEVGCPAAHIHTNGLLDRPDITAKEIQNYCQDGDVILFKASRAVRLERIIEILKEEQNE